jgi:hypothetical protein
VRRLVDLAIEHARLLHVPAGVLAQCWKDGARQVRLARLVNSPLVVVHALDTCEAKAVGFLCGLSGTVDTVDASVVLLARRNAATVVTSDPADIGRMDSTLRVVAC